MNLFSFYEFRLLNWPIVNTSLGHVVLSVTLPLTRYLLDRQGEFRSLFRCQKFCIIIVRTTDVIKANYVVPFGGNFHPFKLSNVPRRTTLLVALAI